MTREEKQMLLKDLCARLPYKVKCSFYEGKYVGTIVNIFDPTTDEFGGIYPLITVYDDTYHKVNLSDFKPYLRPMSSMTKEEKQEIRNFFRKCIDDLHGKSNEEQFFLGFCQDAESLDYLNMHHLDYRGLIEKGLALEAPEGMYNINGN